MDKSIIIRDLNKYFELEDGFKLLALDNINLEINDGEFICLVGPSGSGKSTLLRIIAGLETPSSGSVERLGTNDNSYKNDMGMVFQEYSLFPWRSVIDNVAFGLEIKGVDQKERFERSQHILERFGLGDFSSSFPHELSGGMRQRVAIAKAIADSPNILLMDEPFGALDPQTRIKMQEDLIKFWSEEKRTIIFVTHSIEEAVYLGARIVVLSSRPGKIIHIENINLKYPRNKYTGGFKYHLENLIKIMEEAK